MATAKSFLFLLLSILLLCKILIFTPLSQKYCNNLLSVPNQFYTKVVLNLAFLKSKQQNDDVFPAIGYISTPRSVNRKTPPPPELINEKDMVALTERNFTNFFENNQRVLVIFHTSAWKVSPEHAVIAVKLTGASVVAKVDCETLAQIYKIVRYPSVYFIPGGVLGDKYYSEVHFQEVLEPWSSEAKEMESEKNQQESIIDHSISRQREPVRAVELVCEETAEGAANCM